ncbi:MAG: hypothetical protein H0X18_19025 [Geodermatophilaceae bacterium]|nr:hypothetical protein [Geodermatophilaceae bacterium]
MSQTLTAARSSRPRWPYVLGVLAVVVVIAAGLVWLQSDKADVTRPGTGPGVPADALSPAGTPLPDGFAVPEGADLVGTPIRYELPYPDANPEWQAVLLVQDDAIATWSALLTQIRSVLGVEIEAEAAEGCAINLGQFECYLSRTGSTRPGDDLLWVTAELKTVPGDVTGQYTIRLLGQRTSQLYDFPSQPWPGGDPPAAPSARPRPGVGDPLAPETLAQHTDPADYPLLEGSELLVQYSSGSVTGGFAVLLRVLPGADVDAIGRAYAEQGSQFDGPIEEQVAETDGATVTVYVPPGGAGGYQGTVYAVDNASGADYVYYDLYND